MKKYNNIAFVFLLCLVTFSFTPPNKWQTIQVLDDSTDLLLPYRVQGCEIIAHGWYVLCYNEKYEQANWVSYLLTEKMCTDGPVKRSSVFYKDTMIESGSASPEDYKASGYDRGHLCPAGDMKFSEQAMKESFYMSNMSPQLPSFNRGIWKKLEEQVRCWAIANKELHITTGGILHDNLPMIGMVNKISVPGYFYKVILDNEGTEKKAIGFIIPNCKVSGTIFNYAVTVDSVEKVTGIDFFYALPDSTETKLEMETDTLLWK
jgi:endonuclease G